MSTVRKERIEFVVKGSKIIGHLFIPEDGKVKKYPAVFIGGPMTSVKEQVTGVYAKSFAERGFITLAIDHRYFGESEGTPRQYEKFPDKLLDIKNALDFLKKRPQVDERFISLVGVCLGAGYVLAAASEISGIYRLAAIAGYYRDTQEMKANNLNDFNSKISSGKKAREQYESTGKVLYIPAASLNEEAAMQTKDTVDYYTKRAAVQNYKNSFAVMSREFFTKFDVQIYAEKVTRPFLMIHSQKALSPHWADRFYNNVKTEKSRHYVESRGQTDFYDNTRIVDECVQHTIKHLLPVKS